jgi:hypothetical protein
MYLSNSEVVGLYGKWIKGCLDTGIWEGYLMTMMFKSLSKLPNPIEEIHQEVITLYSKIVIPVVRNPKRPTWADRPRGIFLPDYFLGHRKMTSSDILLNNGLHMHGTMVVRKKSRLKCPLDDVLIKRSKAFYYGDKIRDIDIRLIGDNSVSVANYIGKSVQRGRFSADDILILPRTVDELPRRAR